jgi:probable HAF family extracellular repeat protein
MRQQFLLRTLLALSLLAFTSIAFCQTLQYTSFQFSQGITEAYGVNNSGDIVGVYAPGGYGSGFLDLQGHVQSVGCVGRYDTQANGINDNGVVVGWCPGNPEESYIYENGEYTYVVYPHAEVTWFAGINNSGEIVGYFVGSGPKHPQRAFVYSNGKFTLLPASVQYATGINNSSTIAGMSCSGEDCSGVVLGKTAKNWKVVQTINYPGAAVTSLNGINDNGDIAGYWQPQPDVPQSAFVYLKSSGSIVDLNFNNDNDFAIAAGINNSGEIVGAYASANGQETYGFYGYLQ